MTDRAPRLNDPRILARAISLVAGGEWENLAYQRACKEIDTMEPSFHRFIADVFDEINRAIAKFPEPNANMTALTEEVGELAQALMDKPRSEVWKEAVQVACMAARVAVQGDPTLDPIREKRGADNIPPIAA